MCPSNFVPLTRDIIAVTPLTCDANTSRYTYLHENKLELVYSSVRDQHGFVYEFVLSVCMGGGVSGSSGKLNSFPVCGIDNGF